MSKKVKKVIAKPKVKAQIRKLYHVAFEEFNGQSTGELEMFLDSKYNVVAWWSGSDAQWRDEYMDPLMSAVGVKIEYVGDVQSNTKITAAVEKELRECGILMDEELETDPEEPDEDYKPNPIFEDVMDDIYDGGLDYGDDGLDG